MDNTTKIMYKVCRNNHSVIKHHEKNRKSISYKFGKLIKPLANSNPCIFVFETAENARSFAKSRTTAGRDRCNMKDLSIYEVLALKVHTTQISTTDRIMDANSFPTGTKFCSSLYLLRKVAKRLT